MIDIYINIYIFNNNNMWLIVSSCADKLCPYQSISVYYVYYNLFIIIYS